MPLPCPHFNPVLGIKNATFGTKQPNMLLKTKKITPLLAKFMRIALSLHSL